VSAENKPYSNTLWLIGGRICSALATAVVIGALARHLGPEAFGKLNLVLALMAIAAPLASLNLNGVVVRELIRRPTASGPLLGTAFGLRVLGGGAAFLLLNGATLLFFPDETKWVALASIALLLQPAAIVDSWFQRHLASQRSVIATTSVIYLGAALRLLLVAIDAELSAFVVMIAVEAVLYGVGYFIAYRSYRERSSAWSWSSSEARILLSSSLPLAASGVVAVIGVRFDQVMVALQLGEQEAGFYLAASRFTEFALFAAFALITSLYPRLADSGIDGQPDPRRTQAMFDAVMLVAWSAAIFLALAAGGLITVVLGSAYTASIPLLVAQGWASVLIVNSMIRWHVVQLVAPTSYNLLGAATTVGVQGVLITVCLQEFGAVGATIASAVGALGGGILLTGVLPRTRSLFKVQLKSLAAPLAWTRWREAWRIVRY
jgi:polysaccharide transporter, PST family